jgi:hypothetical protein
MKVRIVCYEDVNAWILGKFALKLEENLKELGVDVSIAMQTDEEADINHHIIYANFNGKRSNIDTLMITHIDDVWKLNLLKNNIGNYQAGICMSRDTMNNLIKLGIPGDKLCFVNPAHDGVIKLKKRIIGITCRVQPDGRKREHFLSKLAKEISPDLFSFIIMGEGWDEQVKILKQHNFEVIFYNSFDYTKYAEIFSKLDLYLYMGQDEGQMGFIDAVAAGIETIVTQQGYHLDLKEGITYPFNTYSELSDIFKTISRKVFNYSTSVKEWNWRDYSNKHLEIWKYLLDHSKTSSDYHFDGLKSLLNKDSNESPGLSYLKYDLFIRSLRNRFYLRIKNKRQRL